MSTDSPHSFETRFDTGPVRQHLVPSRVAGIAALLIGLAGCTGATVSTVAVAPSAGPAPSEILVAVDTAAITDSGQMQAAQQIAPKLQSDLVERLIRAHVTAEPLVPGSSHPGAAVLHVSITQADPGSLVERFVVGFGVGRAKLQAKTELESADGSGGTRLTAFNTASDSGMKPGLILPGGVALATRNAIHLAIGGGIDVAMNIRGGLARPTTSTSNAIVTQLRTYYASAGWYWPDGNET